MKLGLFGINMNACSDPDTAAKVAHTAEAAGFESLWTGEHVVLNPPLTLTLTREGKDIVISTGLDQRQKENFAVGINRLQHRRGIDLAVDRDRNARAHCIGETGVTRIEFFNERLIIGRETSIVVAPPVQRAANAGCNTTVAT